MGKGETPHPISTDHRVAWYESPAGVWRSRGARFVARRKRKQWVLEDAAHPRRKPKVFETLEEAKARAVEVINKEGEWQ